MEIRLDLSELEENLRDMNKKLDGVLGEIELVTGTQRYFTRQEAAEYLRISVAAHPSCSKLQHRPTTLSGAPPETGRGHPPDKPQSTMLYQTKNKEKKMGKSRKKKRKNKNAIQLPQYFPYTFYWFKFSCSAEAQDFIIDCKAHNLQHWEEYMQEQQKVALQTPEFSGFRVPVYCTLDELMDKNHASFLTGIASMHNGKLIKKSMWTPDEDYEAVEMWEFDSGSEKPNLVIRPLDLMI